MKWEQQKRSKSWQPSFTYITRFWALRKKECLKSSKPQVVIFKKLKAALLVTFLGCFLWSATGNCEIGIASYYGNGEKLNSHTANGDVFNPSHLTAASYRHFKKYVRVTAKDRSLVLFVNDKGPNKRLGRVIDLTPWAFKYLCGGLKSGLCKVEINEVSL